jgi:SAM-dependent methyltransferase
MGKKLKKNDLESAYNARYYEKRAHFSGFELARCRALVHFIRNTLELKNTKKVLDYGSGTGLYAEIWAHLFPKADLYFCDISRFALERLQYLYPQYKNRCYIVEDHQADIDGELFDVIVSVEVMEHVISLNKYLQDINRLLKIGGRFIWTTPCANAFSIEHILTKATGQIDKTDEGYRRWSWEDPTHIRRLKSHEIKELLVEHHFSDITFRFRAHLFSYVCRRLPMRLLLPKKIREYMMTLDYSLFKIFPNGASMIGAASKIK